MDYTREIIYGFKLIDRLISNSIDDLSKECASEIDDRYNLLLEYEEFFKYDEKRFNYEIRNFLIWMCDVILLDTL
jgi:hypothetical protein